MTAQEIGIWEKIGNLFGKYIRGMITREELLKEFEKYEILIREQPTLGCGELKSKNSGV